MVATLLRKTAAEDRSINESNKKSQKDRDSDKQASDDDTPEMLPTPEALAAPSFISRMFDENMPRERSFQIRRPIYHTPTRRQSVDAALLQPTDDSVQLNQPGVRANNHNRPGNGLRPVHATLGSSNGLRSSHATLTGNVVPSFQDEREDPFDSNFFNEKDSSNILNHHHYPGDIRNSIQPVPSIQSGHNSLGFPSSSLELGKEFDSLRGIQTSGLGAGLHQRTSCSHSSIPRSHQCHPAAAVRCSWSLPAIHRVAFSPSSANDAAPIKTLVH